MEQPRQMDAHERSAIAVREFRKMLPTLTAFVRAVTGKKTMRVEMGAQSGTDGKKVVIRPPMALANSPVHDRSLCNLRDGNQLLCPACARLEEVYVVIYHEVSHNVAGSMDKFTDRELAPVLIESARKHGSPQFLEFMQNRADAQNMQGLFDVYEYSDEITNFLLGFIRAIDDFRIDLAASLARPGVEMMRWNQTEIILDKGLENSDGSLSRWADAPVEAQIPIALMVGKQGHEIEGRFDERIPELFKVPVFGKLLTEPVPDTLAVLRISVAFLGELNKLGLYDLPLPPPEPMSMPIPGDADPEPGDAGEQSESEDESEDSTPGASDMENDSDGKGNSNSGDSKETEESGDSDSAEDTSQQGEKENQNAGSGRGTGNSGIHSADSDDDQRSSDDIPDGDSSQDDESAPEIEAPGQSGSGEDNDGSDPESDPTDGDGNSGSDAEASTKSGADNEVGENSDSNGESEPSPDAGDKDQNGESSDGSRSTDNLELDADRDSDSESREPDDSHGSDPYQGDEGGIAAEIVGTTDQAPDFSDVGHSTAEEIKAAMEQASGHLEAEAVIGGARGEDAMDRWGTDTMETAVAKALVFDDGNTTVTGLNVYTHGKRSAGWSGTEENAKKFYPIPLKDLSPSILHARRVFSDSKLDKNVRGLKKGKLATAKLGARAWNPQDERLFQRKIRAEGIDDELIIAMDLSGSTHPRWNPIIKRTAFAMADVMHSVGVKFSIFGHTTDAAWSTYNFRQHMYQVKTAQEPWGPVQKKLLAQLPGMEGSLDGHNLEFYRKHLMRSQARRKTLVYYTDGQIPETNTQEEAIIITRELALYKQLGYAILVVCFGTDGPKNYGLDTIKISNADDIVTVIRELESRLTH